MNVLEMSGEDYLTFILAKTEQEYGEVEDDTLGRMYEAGLNILRDQGSTEQDMRIAGSDLAEWIKHQEEGRYAA